MQVQRTLEVQVLIEGEDASIGRTVNYIKTALKGSCRNLNGGAVVLGIYENGSLVGMDITGSPSPELQDMADAMFGEEEEE